MTTPTLHLRTGFVFNDEGRITVTREPGARPGPLFRLVRSATSCAWAVRQDVSNDIYDALDRLAREEPPTTDFARPPVHAARYVMLLPHGKPPSADLAFGFPAALPREGGAVLIEDERPLQRHFRGWVPGEIAAGGAPAAAIFEAGHAVAVCFCARRSDEAAEAGLETAERFRGRGLGPRVTAAWACAVRATGRVPLYSTSCTNTASLAVARKLRLEAYASLWSIE